MKKIITSILFLTVALSLFASSRPRPPEGRDAPPPREHILKPTSTKRLEDRDCELRIITNVSADVYINDFYEGRSDLTVTDLRPGRYRVRLYKDGYEEMRFDVELRPGYRQTYDVDLQKIEGEIFIHDLPDTAVVYVDNSQKSGNDIYVEPGYHDIKVKRFGYNSYSTRLYVEAYEVSDVYPEFSVADFEIYNLSSSRETINPEYTNFFGKTDLSFTVTTNGSAVMTIYDSTGQAVWSCDWTSFSTWDQSVTWDGRASTGEMLMDGNYKVQVCSGDFVLETSVTISRAAAYSLFGINTKGSGVGNLAAVFPNDLTLIVPYFETGVVVGGTRGNFLDIKLGLLCDFAEHYEVNLLLGALPGGGMIEDKQVQFAASFKGSGKIPLGYTGNLCYSGLVHWAFVSEPMPLVSGLDNGNGLGFAGMLGFDSKWFYLGLCTDYIFASQTGSSFKEGSVWENGISVSLKPGHYISADGWFAINSSIGNPDLNYKPDMLYGYTFGGQLIFMFGKSSCMGNLKVQRSATLDGEGFTEVGFGLSYLL